MAHRWLWAAIVGLGLAPGLWAAPAGQPASSPDPALIVRLQPIERLVADAKYLASRVGGLTAVQKLDAAISEMVGGDGLADTGLDLCKPLGLYGIARDDVSASWFVAVIPIADEKAFFGLLDRLEIKKDRLGDGLISLTGEQLAAPVFLRFANGFAYIAANDRAAIAPEKLVTPGRIFAGDEPALASAVLNFDRIPEPVRKRTAFQLTVLNGFTALAGFFGQAGADDENGLDHDLDVAQLRAMARWAGLLLTDGQDVSVRVNFDRQSGELSFDFGGQGRPGSPLAKTIAAMPPTRSLFSQLVRPDAAANGLICTRLLDEQRQVFGKAFGAGAEQLLSTLFEIQELPEGALEPTKALLAAFKPTLEAGVFDCGGSLRGPVKDKYSIVGGLRLKNGRAVESALIALLKVLPEDEQKKLKLDGFKSAGVSVHQYKIFDDADDDAATILGDQPLYFAFRDDAVVFAFGPDGRQLLEDALRTAKEEAAPAATLDFSVKRLTKLLESIDEDAPGWLEKTVGDGIDRVRLFHAAIEGGSKLLARFAFNVQFVVGIDLAIESDDDINPPVPAQPPPGPQPLPPAPPPPPPGGPR